MKENLLLIFQQSELNAVAMYQALAQAAPHPPERDLLRKIGAAEGRHAGILRGLTGKKDLRPTESMKRPVLLLRRALGRKPTYALLAFGELGAGALYLPAALRHPALRRVAADERDHGRALLRFVLSSGTTESAFLSELR